MTSDAKPASMPVPKKPATTVPEYLASFAKRERVLIEGALAAIRAAIPDAQERISYGVIRVDKPECSPLYIGGWNKHIGIYPVPVAQGEFELELAPFRTAKDSLHFAYDQPIPLDLIERVTTYVVQPIPTLL